MSTFTDDFERGDGGLGNNWTSVLSTQTIASGKVAFAAQGGAYNSGISADGRQEGVATVVYAVNADLGTGIYLKGSGSQLNGYTIHGSGTLAAPTWNFRRWASNSATTLRSVAASGVATGTHTLRFLYDGGMLTFWIDGVFVMNYFDNTYATNTQAGIYALAANTCLDSLTIYGNETTTLSVSPSPIGNFGNATTVTFTGVGTSWSAGTPGTPTFTVDHGTLSNQVVASTTSATADYTPGNFLGYATFGDPSTGATALILVTSDTSVVFPPSGAGGLSEAALAWIDAQAAHGGLVVAEQTSGSEDTAEGIYVKGAFGEVLLGKRSVVGTPESVPDPALLYMIWRILNGQQVIGEASFPAPTFDTIDAGLKYLKESLDAYRTIDNWTVAGILDEIKGSAEGATDLNTAIGYPTFSGTFDSVMDQLDQLRGGNATAQGIYDLLQAIVTDDYRTLADVLTAVANVRGSGAPTIASVMAKLALIQTGNLPDLLTIDEHISTMEAVNTAINLVLGAQNKIPGTMAYILDDVWDAVQGIQGAVGSGPTSLWPGVGNVTLGPETPLSDGLELTHDMNGILLTITGYPARTQKYDFGDVASWSRVGAVIFCTDRGDYERSQTFSLDRQILVPMTMELAASCILRLNFGWTGTVRWWTRNA